MALTVVLKQLTYCICYRALFSQFSLFRLWIHNILQMIYCKYTLRSSVAFLIKVAVHEHTLYLTMFTAGVSCTSNRTNVTLVLWWKLLWFAPVRTLVFSLGAEPDLLEELTPGVTSDGALI